MTGPRFSIAWLLIAVALIGGALTALNAQSPVLAGLLTLAMLGVILAAVLGVVCRTGEARYYWLGVALFGGTYFAIAFTPLAPAAKAEIEVPLKSFRDRFWSIVLQGNADPNSPSMAWKFDKKTGQRIASPMWDYAFGTTLHCIVNMAFAWIGGNIGRWFYLRTQRATPPD